MRISVKHGLELFQTASGLKPILPYQDLNRTAIFLKIGRSGVKNW